MNRDDLIAFAVATRGITRVAAIAAVDAAFPELVPPAQLPGDIVQFTRIYTPADGVTTETTVKRDGTTTVVKHDRQGNIIP